MYILDDDSAMEEKNNGDMSAGVRHRVSYSFNYTEKANHMEDQQAQRL